jgi:hypothetical protein
MVLPCRDDSADRQIRFEARPAEDVTHRRFAQVRNKRRFPSGFTCNIRRIGGDPCPPEAAATCGHLRPPAATGGDLRRPAATCGDRPGHLQARLALWKGPRVHRHGNDEPYGRNGRPFERNLEGRRDTRFGRTGCFTCNIRATQVPRWRRRARQALEGAGSISRQTPRPFACARPGCASARGASWHRAPGRSTTGFTVRLDIQNTGSEPSRPGSQRTISRRRRWRLARHLCRSRERSRSAWTFQQKRRIRGHRRVHGHVRRSFEIAIRDTWPGRVAPSWGSPGVLRVGPNLLSALYSASRCR